MDGLRFILASCVLLGHLWLGGGFGTHSVFGFYIVSGYLMTLIMEEKYGYSSFGICAFARNRFLRLFPVYWCACGVSIILLVIPFTWGLTNLNERVFLPQDITQWLYNLLIVFPSPAFFQGPPYSDPALSPATWALTVEMFFYVLIALGLSRSRRRALWWLGLSCVYFFSSYAWLDERYRYYPVFAASLPFSVGACVYRFRSELAHFPLPKPIWLLALFFFLLVVRGQSAPTWVAEATANLNIIVCACLVMALIRHPPGQAWPLVSMRVESWLGKLSYPMYVIHFQAAFVASVLLSQLNLQSHATTGPWLAWPALIVSVAFGALAVRWIDTPINTLKAAAQVRQPAQ